MVCSSGLCQLDLASHCAMRPTSVRCAEGGESDRRSIVIAVSPLTSLMMEQREVEQRDQSTTHEVCRRAKTGSRHNGKRQGRK